MVERLRLMFAEYNGLSKQEKDRYLANLTENSQRAKELRELGEYFLHKKIGGCKLCLLSAFFELQTLTPQKLNTMNRENKLGFRLLAGALLHDPLNLSIDKLLTNNNMSDELALYHLSVNPKAIEFFASYPPNVEELVSDYIARNSDGALRGADTVRTRRLDTMRNELAVMEGQYAARQAEQDALLGKIDHLKGLIAADEKAKEADMSEEVPEEAEMADTEQIVKQDEQEEPKNEGDEPEDGLEYMNGVRARITEYLAAGMDAAAILDLFAEDVKMRKITKKRLNAVIRELKNANESLLDH